MYDIIQINTDNIPDIVEGSSLLETRSSFAKSDFVGKNSEVTIWIQAYNNIEKTKNCIESVLKYTKDIDYDLLLIDNGSTDGTFEYFKSIDFDKKTIIHITKNKGPFLPQDFLSDSLISSYYVALTNDLVVTSNWLKNLLKIVKSDDRIGMVNPMSSNVSNFQGVNLVFSDYDDMQKQAAKLNISDPRKWQERLRLITLGALYKKECLYAIGLPVSDVGFAHNFADDDITFRVRRAGYKAILAGDTWIHHDDDKRNLELEKAIKVQKDLNIGRENFKEKYFGIDAWDDVNNFIPQYLQALKLTDKSQTASILGIDTRCGTPILEIKNHLRNYDIFDADCYAYTTNGKYVIDLQTFCGVDHVHCGEIVRFRDHFETESMDYIVIGNDINTYEDPFNVIRSAFSLLKKGGQLFLSVQNVSNIFAFLYSIGHVNVNNPVHAINYTAEEFLGKLKQLGYNAAFLCASYFDNSVLSDSLYASVENVLKALSIKELEETVYRLKAEHFYFAITKER